LLPFEDLSESLFQNIKNSKCPSKAVEHIKKKPSSGHLNINPEDLAVDPEEFAKFIGFSPEQWMGSISQIDGVLASENAEFIKNHKSRYLKLMRRKPYGKSESQPV